MKAPQTHLFKGKVVDRVDWRPFDDGRGGIAHDPLIIFTDGSALAFMTQETDVGDYGVLPVYQKKGTHKPTRVEAVFVSWTEYERGWGCRGDGCSIHLSMKEWESYYAAFVKRQPKEVPHEYSRPDKPSTITITDPEIVEALLEKKSVRYWNRSREHSVLEECANL
jgi:hypothetical protein